mgnify:CR=1 FL=1
MIRSIRRLAVVMCVLMFALMANATYLQYFAASNIRNRPANTRVLLEEYSRERGPILLGSTAIAQSVRTNDQLKFLRTYADGPMYAPAPGTTSSPRSPSAAAARSAGSPLSLSVYQLHGVRTAFLHSRKPPV